MRSKLPHTAPSIFSVMSNLAHEHDAINLSQGFPNFDPPAALIELVAKAMRDGHNQYAPMPGLPALREVIAEKIRTLYGGEVNPDTDITLTTGATQALFTAISACVHPGDEVILIEPAYDSYRPTVELNGGKVVAYELHGPDYQIDWQAFAQLISKRTRLIVLNTPHNPTGSILQDSDWQALAKIVEGTDILILSDEVYEHLVYDGQKHASILSHPELYHRCFVTASFGKTFHSTGWKMGYCVAPAPLMKEFQKLHQFTVFTVNTPVQYALAEYLQDPTHYLELPAFYQQKRDLLQAALQGTGLRPLACKGTYFQLYNYADMSDLGDVAFAEWLTIEKGIASIPVSVFYGSGHDEKVVRLCFAKTEEVLRAAGERLQNG